jgi:hypothetical protein
MPGFNFKFDALKTTILAALPAAKASPVNGDQSGVKPITDFIAAEVNKLDAKFNGALVIASGEHDKELGRVVVNIQIYGKKL